MTERTFPTRARRRNIIRAALLVSDAVMLMAGTSLASLVRFGQVRDVPAFSVYDLTASFLRISVLLTAIGLAMLWFERLYSLDRVFWGTREYTRVAKALVLAVVGVVLAEYALKLGGISRLWIGFALIFSTAFVILGRAGVRASIVRARRRGHLLKPTLIVGCSPEAADIVRVLRADTASGLVPAGCLSGCPTDQSDADYCIRDVPCIGHVGEICKVLDERFIDTILIASTAFDHDTLARIINRLRGRDVDIQLSSGLFDVTTSRVQIREISGIPLMTIRGISFSMWNRFLKRTFDVLVGGAVVLLGLPLWVLVVLSIRLGSRGPVLYRQQRVGRGGKPFGMYKFRSMYCDADERLAELHEYNEATGPLFKMKDDPRVTPIGKWMRKFSIDECPQLLNVLRGEMSLVGPRPPLPCETEEYSDEHWRRMEVLPGMTGLWQVSGRSSLTFEEMVRLDMFYIENWSLGFDMALLLRTIPAVLFAKGAC